MKKEKEKKVDIYLRGHTGPFVAELSVKVYDDPLLVGRKGALLEIRPQMISPSQPTALPTPHQPTILLHRVPVPFPIRLHVLHQDRVLRGRPRPLLQPPARLPSASHSSLMITTCTLMTSFPAAFADHPFSFFPLFCRFGRLLSSPKAREKC